MVIRVGELLSAIDARAPFAAAADWDPVGLQVGRRDGEVGQVAVVHELTDAVAEKCRTSGVDTIVTYHPLVFRPLRSLTDSPGPEGRALALAGAGMNVIAVHTNWDVTVGGTADAMVEALGLEDPVGFGPAGEVDDGRYIGRIASTTQSAAELATSVGATMGTALRRTAMTESPSRVAVVPGSGGSFVGDAIAAGADVFVTGDVSHHTAQQALDNGMAVIDPGHIATERPGVRALYAAVSEIVGSARDLTDLDVSPWEGS